MDDDTCTTKIFLEKPAAHGLDRGTLCSVKNWWDDQAQGVVMKGIKPSGWPVTD